MERRELIKMIAALTGGAFIGGGLLTGCKSEPEIGGAVFNNDDIAFLDEVAETILPATKSPGAKAAKVGDLMKVMVNDTYEEKDQQLFHKGISQLNEACNKMHGHGFMKATPEQRTALLVALDKEAKDIQAQRRKAEEDFKKSDAPKGNSLPIIEFKNPVEPHYFTMMKQLTLLGFFTSKEGATQALRYIPVPGKYIGDYPYKKGDKAWAT